MYPRHVSEEVDLLARALGSAREVFLFVDYGGTLAPGVPGERVHPDPSVLDKLEQLGAEESFSVFVLSGRTVSELDTLLGIDSIGLIGQRGFEIRRERAETEYPVDPELMGGLIHHLELDAHRQLGRFRGVSIENRGFALAVHLSCGNPAEDRAASETFLNLVRDLDVSGQLEILFGDRTVEARMAGWHKGNAVSHVLKAADPEDSLAIYIGDDVTDEDAFEAVRAWAEFDAPNGEPWFMAGDSEDDEEPPHALTILVAEQPRPTMASMFVRGPDEVREFLSSLAAIASALL